MHLLIASSVSFASDLVRVRLEKKIDLLEISGSGISVQGETANYRPIAIPHNNAVQVSRVPLKDKWFWKVSRDGQTEIKSDPILSISGSNLKLGIRSLPNRILVSAVGSHLDVIGVLPLEDYLVGVLASEMPLSWPIESLKAQAVAARSYTLATIEERKTKLFHVESGIQDQVFRHVVQGVDHDPLVEKAFLAVNSTQGQHLIDSKNGKTLKAFYHADCGGRTSSARMVWGFGDTRGSVFDTSCPSNPKAQWTVSLTTELIAQKLRSLLPQADWASSQLVDVIPFRPDPKGRIESVKLKFTDGKESSILADQFRAALGYSEIKSTQFDIEKGADKKWLFRGRGFGHGVGLCQWGSRAMALQNKTAGEILHHYYPQAKID